MGSVPLISHRQKGQPWPSDSCRANGDGQRLIYKYGQYGTTFPKDEKRNQKLKTSPTNQTILSLHRGYKMPSSSEDYTAEHTVWSHTCQDVRQDVHMRCPQGSIFTSLSFSAHILHSWKVEPISQYNSYCSFNKEKLKRLLS